MLKSKRNFLGMLLIGTFAFLFLCGWSFVPTVYAESPVSGSDGVYNVPVDLSGLAMGVDNFSSEVTVEKNGNNYYMTFGHSSSIDDLALVNGNMQAGYTVKTEGGWTYYTYTLSEGRLQNDIAFSAYIIPMKKTVEISVHLDLSDATRIGDYSYEGERPAEYVPVIQTSAGSEYEVVVGSVFPIPSATASLGSENLDVGITAYYLQNGEKTSVTVADNKITLENVGEYHVVYRAKSNSYQTSLGNPTFSEYDIKIISSVGGSMIAKFEDPNGVLSEGTSILPSRITSGVIYETAAEKMKDIADNYEVFGISLIQADGTEAVPESNITLYLQANMMYDRNEVAVYYMAEDGTLTECSAEGYGRYVKTDTDKTGTFIVCIPGVAFVMPMWGYAIIVCVGGAIVIAAAITIPIVVVKKCKKKKLQEAKE